MVEISTTLLYNLLKGNRMQFRFAHSYIVSEISTQTFAWMGAYFFSLWLSMYDNAANITNNNVRISVVFIWHHPLRFH